MAHRAGKGYRYGHLLRDTDLANGLRLSSASPGQQLERQAVPQVRGRHVRAAAMIKEQVETIVIGAGWAGLGVSYVLAKAGLSHRVLERGRIGETWRTQRWDSFHLNTPQLHAVMPGDRYEGPDPEGFY